MKLGELLKKYRDKQSKNKKEWSGNIISPSFYARVEAGINRISAEDLIDLLHYNKISLIDFFSKLDQNEQPEDAIQRKINRLLNQAYYTCSQQDLEKVREQIESSDLPHKEDELAQIELSIAALNNDFSQVRSGTREKIKAYLYNVDKYDVDSLNVYCNCIGLYNLTENLSVSHRIVRHFKNSDNPQIQKNILGVIFNMLILCIEGKQYNKTDFFIKSAKEIKTLPETFFYKSMLPFFSNLIEYHYKPKDDYLRECLTVIDNVSSAGMLEYSQELKKFLEENI
ncbi:hypothetical protein [Lactobacillus sp. ESL0681]|uniref:Rgg family transcriptional regulator n=1 Tax=Lactobacillus sp. ESL0681 TaxID=2983211 RepID=UPI0023F8B84C|nr:hypothetical protein [Lactobacillus sp. ESL0681]WEV39923.1 hypothetical protein OZX59_06845 [Lactobacillus sp. ESL0681]